MDVHQPCFPPTRYRERFGLADVSNQQASDIYSRSIANPESLSEQERTVHRALADAALEYTDDQLGRVVDALRDRGQFDDTLVVLASDHGHLYGDHGEFGKPERMYDELLRVPLVVVNGPKYLDDASNNLVSLLDVPPMVHDALGVRIPEAYEGYRPGVDKPRSLLFAEHEIDGNPIVGVRSEEWLFEQDRIRNEQRLYRLIGTDGRLECQPTDHAAAADLRTAVATRLDEIDLDGPSLDRVDGDVQDRLEDLGYL